MKRVFVYGTLKKGHGNNRVLGNSTFLGEAITCADGFFMYTNGGFPYVLRNGSFFIKGELYEVTSDEVLRGLDRLEGYPSHYDRILITAKLVDSKDCLECEVYVAAPDTAKYVQSSLKALVPDDNNILEWH